MRPSREVAARHAEKLRALPHFELENWAVIALGGIPNKVQVGDMGVDGRIFPVGTKPSADGPFADDWFPIQVKQVDKVGRPDIDAFEAVMEREGEGDPSTKFPSLPAFEAGVRETESNRTGSGAASGPRRGG